MGYELYYMQQYHEIGNYMYVACYCVCCLLLCSSGDCGIFVIKLAEHMTHSQPLSHSTNLVYQNFGSTLLSTIGNGLVSYGGDG